MVMKKGQTSKKRVIKKDPFKLQNNKAILLAEACKLNKRKKAIDKRLKEIRVDLELELTAEGKYTNKAGDSVVVTSAVKYSEVTPGDLLKELKRRKLGKLFPTLVKVKVAESIKIISEDTFNSLRKKLDPTVKWTFS